MTDRDSRDRNRDTVVDLLSEAVPVADPTPLTDVAMELEDGLNDFGLGPSAIERVLDGTSLPEAGELDVTRVAAPDARVAEEQADAVVDAGGQAVDVMVEGSGEAATVLVDTGGDVVEITTEGGEMAAEATAELLVAALEGV
ncbi:hypothetical protein SAMN05216388_1004300 [Halorientalis persicus]|jgi:hypothetical protein|uniref:Uncharacterized protein n=1 Tax=Halorientalis persicus TaxID=1367881 RepID=A0A1H8IXK2_9EURY|nr:hypothetical protein [Halorientalis persicus]SEN72905.1 hypothetical protein SAMN05216388_1004300 [Halorientalis persicus]